MRHFKYLVLLFLWYGLFTGIGRAYREPLPEITKKDFKKHLRFSNWKYEPKIIIDGIDYSMVLVWPGAFMMGSPKSEEGHGEDEAIEPVIIKGAYYIGVTEVTRRQWYHITGDKPKIENGSCGDDCPIVQMSWERIQYFLSKLNDKGINLYFRLPTEEEWEYACRAGSKTRFCFGNEDVNLGTYAWYKANSNESLQTVAGRKSNRWGIFDMHGNVWEWCQDQYMYYRKEKNGNETNRVLRGGSYTTIARSCRSANRFAYPQDQSKKDIGFRMVAIPVE